MQTLKEIRAQIAELQAQEKLICDKEYSQALKQVQELIDTHNIVAADLVFKANESPPVTKSKNGSTGKKAEVKFRDENGKTWSGRGLQPKWLTKAIESGKKLEEFAVAKAS